MEPPVVIAHCGMSSLTICFNLPGSEVKAAERAPTIPLR
jgi:hypothetical protein